MTTTQSSKTVARTGHMILRVDNFWLFVLCSFVSAPLTAVGAVVVSMEQIPQVAGHILMRPRASSTVRLKPTSASVQLRSNQDSQGIP